MRYINAHFTYLLISVWEQTSDVYITTTLKTPVIKERTPNIVMVR